MTCWGPDKLWSPIGKKPIGSLKRTPCYAERFWVSFLPPTHPGFVSHEEGDKSITGMKVRSNQVGKMCILGAEQHICGYSALVFPFYLEVLSGSSCESGMWIIPGQANFTSPFPLLPHSLCPLQSLSPAPPPVTPASTSACLRHSSSSMGFLLQASYTVFPSECISLPVPIDDSKYILPIFYLVILSLGILFAFHPFFFQTHPIRESLVPKLFIKHKSSFWMHISNVSKAWKSLQCVVRH